uniref:Putative iron-sulfur binding domain containing protein n=1 Tax=viral metagenome TaxID=1070528 RepID=A0A6H1ZHZ4_9ZZZZ
MKLRLLVTKECDRDCHGCCNDQYNLDALPVETDFRPYEEIIITGGEPMLTPNKVLAVVREIRRQTIALPKIYMYTANADYPERIITILEQIHGLTFALHNRSDIMPLNRLTQKLLISPLSRSLRLYIIEKVDITHLHSLTNVLWQTKVKKWEAYCPLPDGEVLKRIEW